MRSLAYWYTKKPIWLGRFNLMVFFTRLYFISIFCDIIQFTEKVGVHFSAGLSVTAILHVSVFQLVGDRLTIA